ncbi:hypothetical protein F5Y10DRAFT_293286 [Nemania abortiva]|nr:hypothetical protein F5Y10DRAFT_293286 [Nemania abortiva]
MGIPAESSISIPNLEVQQESDTLLARPWNLPQRLPRIRHSHIRSNIFWTILTLSNVSLFGVSMCLLSWHFARFARDDICLRYMYPYSPAFEAVEYYDTQWQNDFDEKDEYRGPPTLERDRAWLNLWSMGDIVIKKNELSHLNKTWEESRRFYLPSIDGIAANLEVFHQLHCLDMIRRYTYLDWYTEETMPDDMKNTPAEDMREHIDHCVTTLRLALTCTADVAPILMSRGRGKDEISVDPDMRTTHKCRRLDKIQEWFIQNSYTNYKCIQQGGIGCHLVPTELQ